MSQITPVRVHLGTLLLASSGKGKLYYNLAGLSYRQIRKPRPSGTYLVILSGVSLKTMPTEKREESGDGESVS